MVSHRVHVVLSAEERAACRAAADGDGVSLSEWIRTAARARLGDANTVRTVDELDAFFAGCNRREGDDPEPDWSAHLAVIARSRTPDLPT